MSSDARNLHSYVFMETGEIGRCSDDDQLPFGSDSEYSDSDYSDSDYSDSNDSDNESGTVISGHPNPVDFENDHSENESGTVVSGHPDPVKIAGDSEYYENDSDYSENDYSENDSGTVKFAGVVLVYSPNTTIMSRQLQIFLPKGEEAAGKISGAMGKFIKQR